MYAAKANIQRKSEADRTRADEEDWGSSTRLAASEEAMGNS